MIKLRKIVWAEHVACMEKKKNAYRALMINLRDDLEIDGRRI
jgi:ribonuclease I